MRCSTVTLHSTFQLTCHDNLSKILKVVRVFRSFAPYSSLFSSLKQETGDRMVQKNKKEETQRKLSVQDNRQPTVG